MHQESVAYLSVFIVRKLKQATSSSICAVTYPEILLKHREIEKKYVKCSQTDGLHPIEKHARWSEN